MTPGTQKSSLNDNVIFYLAGIRSSKTAAVDLSTNSQGYGVSCRAEVCPQRPCGTELHVSGCTYNGQLGCTCNFQN